MNRNFAKKLVAALESGFYKQCTSRLHKTDGTFCFSGVVCDLNNVKWIKDLEIDDNCYGVRGENTTGFSYLHCASVPIKILKDIEVEEIKMKRFISANDRGASFQDLANLIRQGINYYGN